MINFETNRKKIKRLEEEIYRLEKINESYKKLYYEEFTRKESLILALIELKRNYTKLNKKYLKLKDKNNDGNC